MHEDLDRGMDRLADAAQKAHELREDFLAGKADPLDLVMAGNELVMAEAEKEVAARRWLRTL